MKARRQGKWAAILRYGGYVLALLLVVWAIELAIAMVSARNETRIIHANGMRMDAILGPDDLDGPALSNTDFDVTSAGGILLRNGNSLYEVPPGTQDLSDLGLAEPPDSLALDSKDAVLAVTDRFFGAISRDEKTRTGVPLPYSGARLARSVQDGAVYLFGGIQGDHRLYRFIDDGTFQVLLQTPEPIVAATDTKDAVLAATAKLIVRVAWPKPVLLFKAPAEPGWGPIVSLAAADDGLIFFSTPGKVYALRGGVALTVVSDSGGSLRMRGDRLFVFDGKRRLLYALSPASMAMFGGGGK